LAAKVLTGEMIAGGVVEPDTVIARTREELLSILI
jgi:hypothetical protein